MQRTRYCDTGSVKTPIHGRGERNLVPNGRYISSDDEGGSQRQQADVEKVMYERIILLLVKT